MLTDLSGLRRFREPVLSVVPPVPMFLRTATQIDTGEEGDTEGNTGQHPQRLADPVGVVLDAFHETADVSIVTENSKAIIQPQLPS